MRIVDAVPPPEDGWWDHAACRGLVGDRLLADGDHPFYPGPGKPPERPVWREGCDFCPVRLDCLAHGLRAPEPHGVWGGTTERERERMARRLRRGTLDWGVVASGALWPEWRPPWGEEGVLPAR